MIAINHSHPYETITQFVLNWIGCLVRGDYDAADAMVDEFEDNGRIGDYFSLNEDERIEAIDPIEDEWWQITFNPSRKSGDSILVEAYVPLSGDYRPFNACFVFVRVADEYKVIFQHCTPS